MLTEHSCGAVVFTRDSGEIKYVVIQSITGFFGFPKGHKEAGEAEEQTALREIFEETGLRVNLIDGFKVEDVYPIKNGTVLKRVTYFLAEYSNQQPAKQEEEILRLYLLNFDDAIKRFQMESNQRVLTQARDFLESLDK